MPSKEKQLAARCTFLGGFAFSDQYQGHQEGDLPFIKVSDMSATGNEKYIRAASNWVDSNLAKEKRWHPAPAGGVVFAKVGAALKLNRRRILSQPTIFDNNMMVAIPENGTDTAYLYHLLNSIDFNRLVQEGAVPSITQGLLGRITILDFSQREQKVIGHILDVIDHTIEATQAVIKQTRQLRSALLQDLLTNGLPGRHREFQTVYRMGKIPGDWRPTRLDEVAGIIQGIALGPKRVPRLNSTPYLRVANVKQGYMDLAEIKEIEASAKERLHYGLYEDDVLMVEGHANIEELGRAALGTPKIVGMIYQNHLFRVRTDPNQLDPRFLTIWVNSPAGRAYFKIFGGTTSGLNTVGTNHIRALRIPLPQIEEQAQICTLLESLDQRVSEANNEVFSLTRVKQALSQGLLTGRIPVSVAGEEGT